MTHLELHAGDLRLALCPDQGAAIAGLWLGDLPVLRSTDPATLTGAHQSGAYVLAPYSNRLGLRRFRWHGREHSTLPNFDNEPHSLHGVAWQRAWTTLQHSDSEAVLAYSHAADGHWPFAFTLQQRLTLSPQALDLRLSFVNTDAQEQPVGLGWHPYFPRRPRSRLHAELSARWENDAQKLPTRSVAQAGLDGDVAHMAFDHCFDGWRGAARIRDEKLALKLTSSMTRLVVFTPEHGDFFCVEPVSHVNNAVHMAEPTAHGLVALAPGATLEAWVRLEVSRV
ncbi:MAG: aldose 1-epimerase [Burkholderiales bacterium]|nr:aldose 1-epimerase [Burkholderiales bacterium]